MFIRLRTEKLRSQIVEEMTVNKNNSSVVIWMFVGMVLGVAIGCAVAIGVSKGSIGIPMCFGLVFGTISGIGIGTAIKRFKDKK